ncbi:uncharacterized protein PHACADRAFT_128842 [Phanerochaete carnosa HHB-10118-sp]|uniref:MYND-type domain-containing protein n=1 Tax=Phanerochaete carnosa (strain HHB-10118-sp) TaxID=650164 RepID=K5WLB8_PHACS|nr:uncharacterized protein PHACADRAFT_128842 [Phanerochaete carnosa HHB-10118-sp]EKM51087.1 hypothetical protein PHACADRAFT_128842 [Phanerochaete carnosa HHB-10118-sp]
MAREARLLDNPLPKDTDFTDEEVKEIQSRLNALVPPLPPSFTDPLFIAFSANYLPALATALRTLSRETQRKAFSTLVQILSLLPDPERDPYFRRFLGSSQFAGLPTLLASAFGGGVAWLRPSGPGSICNLLFYALVWCDPAMGDDKQTCIDKDTRDALAARVAEIQADPSFPRIDATQRAQVARLAKTLATLTNIPGAGMPAPVWLNAQRGLAENSVHGLNDCAVCFEEDEALFLCSKCKTVKYCSQECQLRGWKQGHKIRCFETTF